MATMHVPTPDDLAAMMRALRVNKKLTVAEAGAWLGISPRTVENIEQGRGYGNPRTLALAIRSCLSKKRLHDPLD